MSVWWGIQIDDEWWCNIGGYHVIEYFIIGGITISVDESLDMIKRDVNRLSNIDYQTDELCKLQRQLIRRLEYVGHQQELTNNLLISIATCSSREDLVDRVSQLLDLENGVVV